MELIHNLVADLPTILAQKVEDPQIMDQMKENFDYFIKSGQVWALGIGFFLGYLFRSFTSF
jgi:hypothetical protein